VPQAGESSSAMPIWAGEAGVLSHKAADGHRRGSEEQSTSAGIVLFLPSTMRATAPTDLRPFTTAVKAIA